MHGGWEAPNTVHLGEHALIRIAAHRPCIKGHNNKNVTSNIREVRLDTGLLLRFNLFQYLELFIQSEGLAFAIHVDDLKRKIRVVIVIALDEI